MANHLIIGLGGTGGKILRAMRKRIYEEFGTNDPAIDTHISYIYVDSDEKDLNDNESWNYMGHPVYLSPGEKVNIHGIGGRVMRNLNDYPGIRAFVSEDDRQLMLDDQITAIIDAGIGGQRRRFGRILLANNITNGHNNSFTAVLRQRIINIINQQGHGSVTFHICAGLAGGTGSGSIVDAVAQLHKIIAPMGNAFDVFLYLYVPEILVEQNVNVRGYYHANGYAALQEINSMALNKYKPLDISGQIDPRTNQVRRLIDGLNAEAFTRAYLFSNINEVGRVLDKYTKLPDAVADFLYQRIVSGATEGGQLQKVAELENQGTPPEQDAAGKNVHARNFATFGIKRIEYPESEIKAYATEKSVGKTITGLVYNSWIEHRGFDAVSDEDAGIGFTQEVRLPATLERLQLDDRHLTLQTPVANFAGSDEWKPYDNYWDTYCAFFAADILECENDRRQWVARFLDVCNTEYGSNFRGIGVNRFFNSMSEARELNRYASVICKHIENTLFSEWVAGMHDENRRMSLQKIRIYLAELISAMNERMAIIDTISADLERDKVANYNECQRIKDRLEDTGWLGAALGATRKLFTQYTSLMARDYSYRTKIKSYKFAKSLLQEIISRLSGMKESVVKLENLFRQAITDANNNAEAACRPNEANGRDVEVTDKRYDPDTVRDEVENLLLSDSDVQEHAKTAILQSFKKIVDEAGKDRLFRTVYETMGGGSAMEDGENTLGVISYISRESQTAIENRLSQIAAEDENRRLLGVNILERIKQECPTDAMLDNYLHDIVDSMKAFIPFSEDELGIVPAGQVAGEMVEGVQLCLPEYADPTDFRKRFIDRFAAMFAPGVFNRQTGVAVNPKSNQIIIITVKSGFPLRFIRNVRFLKEQYDNMTAEHNIHHNLNKVLLHTESLSDRTLPSLFEEDAQAIRQRMILLGLKAYLTPGLIEQGEDPETGDVTYEINTGTRMNENIHTIGKNFLRTVDLFCQDAQLRGALTDHVEDAFNQAYRTVADKRTLPEKVENFVFDTVLPLCGGNRRTAQFIEVRDIANELINSVNN